MRDELRALTPEALRVWLSSQRALLAPRVNGTRPAGDRLAVLLACLEAPGCARCAAPLVERAAWKAGQVLCPTCALAAGGATVPGRSSDPSTETPRSPTTTTPTTTTRRTEP
jgi:hypothetical protein